MRKLELINDKIDNIDTMLELLRKDMGDLYRKQDLCQKTIDIKNDNGAAVIRMHEEDAKIIESLIKQYYADKECFDAAMVAPKNHMPILINHGETIKMDNIESFNISWNCQDGYNIDVEYR